MRKLHIEGLSRRKDNGAKQKRQLANKQSTPFADFIEVFILSYISVIMKIALI